MIVQALSFMFEYIGEMAKDYIYAVAPLLEDALMDRDLVHRQASNFCSLVLRVCLRVVCVAHARNYLAVSSFIASPP